MGIWGTRIFDDDGAADIYAEYRILLGYKVDPEKAWQLIYNYFYPEYKESDDEDVFWLSVALFQWQNGILKEEVKQRAIQCIDDESYLEVWKESDPAAYKKRRVVLAQLKEKLINEVNPPRKVAKCPPYYREKTQFSIGDIFSYTHENGKISYIEAVRIRKKPVTKLAPELDYQSTADFALLDVWSKKQYTIEEVSKLPYRKFIDGDYQPPIVFFVFDTFSVYFEKIVRENMDYLGRTSHSASKESAFYGERIIQSYSQDYAPCIESTFSLPCKITNEMLNATLAEFLIDSTPETLNQRIRQKNSQWPQSVCNILGLIVLRNAMDYVVGISIAQLHNRNIEEECKFALLANLPWINKENKKKLIEKCIPKDASVMETEYAKQVSQSVRQYLHSLYN